MDSDRHVPASGRRRAGPRPRRAWPRVLAAAVVFVGTLLVLLGGLRATVFVPDTTSRATLLGPRLPLVVTSVGLLGLDGPRVRVDVTDSAKRPVFLGIGRAADVDAYLARASRLAVVGTESGGRLLTEQRGSEASLPDPGDVDVWVRSVRGPGSAELTWPDAPGQWRLVVATDGTASAPDRIQLTWSGRESHTSAPALIAIGLVLGVAGVITLVTLGSRAGLERDT